MALKWVPYELMKFNYFILTDKLRRKYISLVFGKALYLNYKLLNCIFF